MESQYQNKIGALIQDIEEREKNTPYYFPWDRQMHGVFMSLYIHTYVHHRQEFLEKWGY